MSVATRDLPGPFPEQRTHAQIKARSPGLGGTLSDHGFRLDWIDDNDFSALNSGIQRGDILTAIGSTIIRTNEDIQSVANECKPGDDITVRVSRNGEALEFSMKLRAMPITWTNSYGNLPTLFEHDMPLLPNQCGGPVIDLNGKAVGITVFRGMYGCRAIPADCIKRLFGDKL